MRNVAEMNAGLALGDIAVPAKDEWSWLSMFRRSGKAKTVVSAKDAMVNCNTLLKLIANLQQHRGMSSAYLGGNKEFGARMLVKRKEIDTLFIALREASSGECEHVCPCFTMHDVSVLRFKWRSTVEELDSLSVDQSIAEHTALIATTLNWLDAVGEARIGLPLKDTVPLGLAQVYSHRLPALTECLGQARAVGSSVAAQGKCSAVARVRLLFLVSRAETLLEQSAGVAGGDAAYRAVKRLAELVRSRMVASQRIDVDATLYFSQATEAIDTVFAWIESCGHTLQQHVLELRSVR